MAVYTPEQLAEIEIRIFPHKVSAEPKDNRFHVNGRRNGKVIGVYTVMGAVNGVSYIHEWHIYKIRGD
jgi:hypothetical protein